MPERAGSLASALLFRSLLAATLAAGVLYGLNASAAAECLENPDLRITEPGRWAYHLDQNRKCWHFTPAAAAANSPAQVAAPAPAQVAAPAPAQVAASPPAQSAAPAPSPGSPPAGATEDKSFFSRLTDGLSQTFSPPPQALPLPQQPQANTAPDNSGETPQAASPKPPRHNRTVHQERPRSARPAAATTAAAAAGAERQAQPSSSGAASDGKRDAPLNVADREALFQDFMKWQMERSMFGRP